MNKPVLPPALKRGDNLGIIAPASPAHDEELFLQGISVIRDLGFQPIFPQHLWPGSGYLADSDNKRAEEFNKMWADPQIKGLIALRGGFGSLRMAHLIDWNLIRSTPKAFVGFSDITILHSLIQQQTGLVTLHGPVLTSLGKSNQQTIQQLYHKLSGNLNLDRKDIDKVEILKGEESAKGRLTGGNLSSLITLMGTHYEPDWHNCILVLEDVGEPLYRLDRMFTQLKLSGKLNSLSGLILGDFSLHPEQEPLEKLRHHEAIWNRILELTADSSYPVWGGFPTGHCGTNLTLPMGITATMDCRTGVVDFI